MAAPVPPSSLAALAKIGVIRLDAEYKHEGRVRVQELFAAAAATALGRSDFTQPLKVSSSGTAGSDSSGSTGVASCS